MTQSIRHPGWPKVIDALQRKGFTQTQIAARVGVSQPFLSNLKSGGRTSMRFEDGLKLFSLYLERVRCVRIGIIREERRG